MEYSESRQQVLQYAQMLSARGFFGTLSGAGGNVSLRLEGEAIMAITPSGKSYDTLMASDICVVDFTGRQLAGAFGPSIEAGLHRAVYEHRPDAGAVIHTHQVYASIFAVINRPVPILFDEALLSLGPVVEVAPYAVSGTPELEQSVTGLLGNGCGCYIMQNHGALAVASTLEKAYHNVELLEKCARIYYYALTTGQEITTIPQVTVEAFLQLRGLK